MKAELDIKTFLKAINEFATAEEQQPCAFKWWRGLVFSSLEYWTEC